MSVLVTADLHFSDNPRDYNRHTFVDSLIEAIQEHEVTTLLVLGDLTEKKDKHSAWLTNTVANHFHLLSTWCRIIILQGNHDALDTECPFFRFLTHVGNEPGRIRWVSDPSSLNIQELGRCLFLPHTNDYRTRWNPILALDNYVYIFAHNTFKGTVSESGMELDGIPVDVFPKRSRVISGDIHKPQVVGPVTYVGSPYLVDFGDDFEPRMLLLRGRNKITSIPCKGPQKRSVDVLDVTSTDIAISDKVKVNSGDVLRVRVPVTKEDYANWDDIKRKVRAWGESVGAEVYTIQPVMEVDQHESKGKRKKKRSVVEPDRNLVKRYADLHGYGSKVVRIGYSFVE